MNTTLTYRLATLTRLKWRLLRNFAKRRPLEATLRFAPMAFFLLYWLVFVAATASPAHRESLGSPAAYVSIGLWGLFLLVTFVVLTTGRVVHTIDLGHLTALPIGDSHFFAITLLDAALVTAIPVILVLALPLLLALSTTPADMLLLALVLTVFLVFVAGWAHLLAILRSLAVSHGLARLVADALTLILVAVAGAFFLLPGLKAGIGVFTDIGYWAERLAAARKLFEASSPVLDYLPPGMAVQGFMATLSHRGSHLLVSLVTLTGETALCLWLMYRAMCWVYRGEVVFSPSPPPRKRRALVLRFAAANPFGSDSVLSRLAGLDFWQLVRKEWLYAWRFKTMVTQILLAPVGWVFIIIVTLVLPNEMLIVARGWMILGAACFSVWLASEVLAQKFNWEGPGVSVLFLLPMPRGRMLAAKSLALLLPVIAVNLVGLVAAWCVIGAPARYHLAALVILLSGIAIADAHGSVLSVLTPVNLQAYTSTRKRRPMEQSGCLAQLALHLATFVLSLTVLPLLAAMVWALAFGGVLGLMTVSVLIAAGVWLYCRWVHSSAVRLLKAREAAIIRELHLPD